jgi:hypothetical protein
MRPAVPRDTLEERDRESHVDCFLVVFRKNTLQLCVAFIPHHYVKQMVVDDLLDAIGDALEKLVSFQDGG